MSMDINGMSTAYSDLYANAADQSASRLENNLKKDYAKTSEEELLNACKEFEAYFIEQMYKGMMKTIPQNEESSGSTATMVDYYKDQMVQTLASETSKQNSLGLAQQLYEQMKRNYNM